MDFELSSNVPEALEYAFNEETAFSDFKINVNYEPENNDKFVDDKNISNFIIKLIRKTDNKIIGHQYLFINKQCDIMFGKGPLDPNQAVAHDQMNVYTWNEELWHLPYIQRNKFCIFVKMEIVEEDEKQKGYSKYLHWALYTLVEFLCDPRKIHSLPAAIRIGVRLATPPAAAPYILLNDLFLEEYNIKRYKRPFTYEESGLMGEYIGPAHEPTGDLTDEYPYDFNAYYNDPNLAKMITGLLKLKKDLVENIKQRQDKDALLHPVGPAAPAGAGGGGAAAQVDSSLENFLVKSPKPGGGRRKRNTKKSTKMVRRKKQKKRTFGRKKRTFGRKKRTFRRKKR